MTLKSKLFNDAADLIEEFGWMQHRARGPDKQYCLTAAIDQAIMNNGRCFGHSTALRTMMLKHVSPDALYYVGVLPSWNDEKKRTKEQVISALRECAELARVEENRQATDTDLLGKGA